VRSPHHNENDSFSSRRPHPALSNRTTPLPLTRRHDSYCNLYAAKRHTTDTPSPPTRATIMHVAAVAVFWARLSDALPLSPGALASEASTWPAAWPVHVRGRRVGSCGMYRALKHRGLNGYVGDSPCARSAGLAIRPRRSSDSSVDLPRVTSMCRVRDAQVRSFISGAHAAPLGIPRIPNATRSAAIA
jgi:hypothetical protein